MQGWISIVAVSAVLSAGLVAGRAAADSVEATPSATASWSDPPAKAEPKAAAEAKAAGAKVPEAKAVDGPACTANAWASLPSGCHAQGRAVRVIALTQR